MIMPPSQPVEDASEKKEGEAKAETAPAAETKETEESAAKETEIKSTESEKKEAAVEPKKEEPSKAIGEVKEEQKEPEKQMAPKITPKSGNLLVVSSSDVVNVDYLTMQSYQPNLFFFRNAIEVFSLGEELINIRAKTMDERNLTETTDGQRTRYKILNMAIVPLLLIAFGVVRYAFRRRQAVKAQKA